jgi:hypothetical protein
MDKFQRIIHHPAGRIGLTVGLTIGLVAALMGEVSKALFFVSFCHFLASRIKRT